MKKEKRRVNLMDSDDCDDYPGDEWTAPRVLEWFAAKVAEIPKEHIEHSWFRIDLDDDYDQQGLSIEIGYERDETDEEARKRAEQDAASLRYKEEQERAILEALRKKYESR